MYKYTGTQDQYPQVSTAYPPDRHSPSSAAALVGPLPPIGVILSVCWERSIPLGVLPQISHPPPTSPLPGAFGKKF